MLNSSSNSIKIVKNVAVTTCDDVVINYFVFILFSSLYVRGTSGTWNVAVGERGETTLDKLHECNCRRCAINFSAVFVCNVIIYVKDRSYSVSFRDIIASSLPVLIRVAVYIRIVVSCCFVELVINPP